MFRTAKSLAICTALFVLGIGVPGLAEDEPAPNAERRATMLLRWDADGDGKLSEDELAAAREAKRERRGERRQERRLLRWDADGDGKLSEEERAAAAEQRERNREALLEKYDADGDGRLSPSERHAARADGARLGRRGGGPGRGR